LLAELAATFEIPDVKMAEENYGKALSLAHELSMRPVIAHCHHGLGMLDRRLCRSEKAREHLTAVATM
jgi:hypothetical protein